MARHMALAAQYPVALPASHGDASNGSTPNSVLFWITMLTKSALIHFADVAKP